MLRAILDTGRAALDIILIGAAAGMVVGALNISGISFGLTLQLIALSGQQPVRAAAAHRHHQHHPRHGHADGERLCAHRHAARAVDRQARRHADGRAYVRDVFRHAVDDHAAGGDRRLCRRQYRAGVGLDHRLDRGGGRLEHVLHPVPVRHRAEPADARHRPAIAWNFAPQSSSASSSAPRQWSALPSGRWRCRCGSPSARRRWRS